jgi:hypothetical protein
MVRVMDPDLFESTTMSTTTMTTTTTTFADTTLATVVADAVLETASDVSDAVLEAASNVSAIVLEAASNVSEISLIPTLTLEEFNEKWDQQVSTLNTDVIWDIARVAVTENVSVLLWRHARWCMC